MFIGMAPGVGKTYRMLEEAHQLNEEGIDVVIGLVETHGREETAEQAVGLEVVPKKKSFTAVLRCGKWIRMPF
jgi:two-component system sensor histidine kinase KdpD